MKKPLMAHEWRDVYNALHKEAVDLFQGWLKFVFQKYLFLRQFLLGSGRR
ncbi:MAG TPA: hypothetical protein VF402_09760 [Asticcacaulis sp.]